MTIHRRVENHRGLSPAGFEIPGLPAPAPATRPSRLGRLGGFLRGRRGMAIACSAVLLLLSGAAVQTMTASAAEPGTIPAGAIRAESFSDQSGAKLESTVDVGGGQSVGWLASGDWMRYNGVDLGPAGSLTTSLRIAAGYADRPGTVEIRLDSVTGELVAEIPVTTTNGWQRWSTRTDTRPSPGGQHDVFLVLRSDQPHDFVNINWFLFVPGELTPAPSQDSTSMSTSAPASPSMPPMAPPPAGSWIPVDQAAWKAQLAAFRALTPRAIPANPNKNAEFNATCTFSHSGADDPIVFPGMPGASHMHTFIGNDSTNASTTPADLMRLTASSCQPLEDHSAYWIPTLYEHGKPVQPKQVIVYYGSLLEDKTKTVPMPNGLRMIAGDAMRQVPTPKGAVNQFYCAGGPQDGKTRSADGNWPVCDGGTLHFTLRFPDCWDGKHLDSPNHKGHVSFGAGGRCPNAYPVRIPAVTFSIAYPTNGSTAGFKLASGMASSMHGDGFFAWAEPAMASRVKNCVVQVVQCNTAGKF